MHCLRHISRLSRPVLAWFALFLAVSVLSPWVRPVDLELVCSASGDMQLLPLNGEEPAAPLHTQHLLDCPACLPLLAPPAVSVALPVLPPLAGLAPRFARSRPKAVQSAAPPPARGPPEPV